MLLASPSLISHIDSFAAESLGIPAVTLMSRAGEAVACAARELVNKNGRIHIFAGKGNNGGDGYGAACLLMNDYDVTVYDVFSSGQRSPEGKHFLDLFTSSGGKVIPLLPDDVLNECTDECDLIIDAVFGTGFTGELPEIATKLIGLFNFLTDTPKLAIDVPLGISAYDGSLIGDVQYHADVTVVLGFIKHGLVSYPAREYVGNIKYDNIGLHNTAIISKFSLSDHYTDYEFASSLVPVRCENSSKGSFGKLLLITGSSTYPGAAHLSLEAALRAGAGYVTYLGEKPLCDSLILKLPEAIYKPLSITDISPCELDWILTLSDSHTAILVGSGSSRSAGLYSLVYRLLTTEGAPLILDADAINVLSDRPDEGRALIRHSKRRVILTPHPLELSRISGIPTELIQANRFNVARSFAGENNCILVLKGAGTIVTDGKTTFINSTGSSALAKAGSGDVLAGFLASLVASGSSPLEAAALAVYVHGLAADRLSEEYSKLGVTPSDLPREMARQVARLVKNQ